jgi:hypothetical protein
MVASDVAEVVKLFEGGRKVRGAAWVITRRVRRASGGLCASVVYKKPLLRGAQGPGLLKDLAKAAIGDIGKLVEGLRRGLKLFMRSSGQDFAPTVTQKLLPPLDNPTMAFNEVQYSGVDLMQPTDRYCNTCCRRLAV